MLISAEITKPICLSCLAFLLCPQRGRVVGREPEQDTAALGVLPRTSPWSRCSLCPRTFRNREGMAVSTMQLLCSATVVCAVSREGVGDGKGHSHVLALSPSRFTN